MFPNTHAACIVFFMIMWNVATAEENPSLLDDLLLPYETIHRSTQHTRRIREIQSPKYNYTYESFPANCSEKLIPTSETRYFVSDIPRSEYFEYDKVIAYGHVTTVTNPLLSVSVLEPHGEGGCSGNVRETVKNTAEQRNCIVAQNGGFFNTTSGACLGNIVSDGRMVQDSSAIHNVNFGITKNGSIIVGYLSDEDIEGLQFQQLVQGAIWLVRNGEPYVEEAFKCESSEIEETGTLRTFIDVQSARTAIGHDIHGKVVMVHVEGQTRVRGVNLDQFARLLVKEFQLVNAINLDGGGSATLVLNGTLANYPSDHCKSDPEWRCARAVTTVICVHEPDCVPECKHGDCLRGRCSCKDNFRGETCDELYCGKHNCSQHGVCIPEGCDCHRGWHGVDCTIPCGRGWFGKNCSQECRCRNNGSCDSVTGDCDCLPGFGGSTCENGCDLGSYGKNCKFKCHCSDTCACDSATGICTNATDVIRQEETTIGVAQCLARKSLEKKVAEKGKVEAEQFHWMALISTAAAGLALSLAFNVYLLLTRSRCLDNDEGAEYIPLEDVSINHKQPTPTSRKTPKPFSVKSKKRTRLKPRLPSWNRLIKKFRHTRNKPSREGYTQLVLPDSNIEVEETALMSQFR